MKTFWCLHLLVARDCKFLMSELIPGLKSVYQEDNVIKNLRNKDDNEFKMLVPVTVIMRKVVFCL